MDDGDEEAAYACCSAGIGRWCWLVWANEEDARARERPLATGYEKTAGAAEAKALEAAGPGAKRLPGKWASAYKRGGGAPRPEEDGGRPRPRSRLSRPPGMPARAKSPARPTFLYAASEAEEPGARGEVAVVRHRIVRRTARKIYIDREPFREEEGAADGEGSPPDAPRPRTLAVDLETLRREGRFPHRGSFFYASEDAGVRDVHATLTARHPWCAALGVSFPCTAGSIKAAYRRLVRETHPDVGGDAAAFRSVERAYREALAYFDAPPPPPGPDRG